MEVKAPQRLNFQCQLSFKDICYMLYLCSIIYYYWYIPKAIKWDGQGPAGPAGLLQRRQGYSEGFQEGHSYVIGPSEIPRSSPATPRKVPSILTLFLRVLSKIGILQFLLLTSSTLNCVQLIVLLFVLETVAWRFFFWNI